MMRFIAASALETSGFATVAVGLWVLSPWLGITVAGVSLVLLGLAIDPPRRGRNS